MTNAFEAAGVRRHGTCLIRGREKIELTAREAAVVDRLLETPGTVVSRSELIERAYQGLAARETLLKCIRRIRHKLDGLGAPSRLLIVTVRRAGYYVPASLGEAERTRLLHVGPLSFDPDTLVASWEARTLAIPQPCAKLLTVLMEAASRTVTTEALGGAAGHDRDLRRRLARLGALLAALIDDGRTTDEILLLVPRFGYRLTLPDDPRYVRCWGIELDRRDESSLRINGHSFEVTPTLHKLIAWMITHPGVPVDDAELIARPSGSSGYADYLNRFLHDYGWLVEPVPAADACRLALERLNPGLVQVGSLLVSRLTGQVRDGEQDADLTPRQTAITSRLMLAPDRTVSAEDLLDLWPTGDGTVQKLDVAVRRICARLPRRAWAPPVIARNFERGTRRYGLRAHHDPRPLPLHVGPIETDPETGETRVNGLQLALGRRAHKMLVVLLQRPGQPIPRGVLTEALAIPPAPGDPQLTAAAHELDRALATGFGNTDGPELIIILRNVGIGLAIEGDDTPVRQAHDLRLNLALRTVSYKARRHPRPLSPADASVLAALLEVCVQCQGAPVTHDTLLAVSGLRAETLAGRIYHLRRVLAELGLPDAIRHHVGKGFSLSVASDAT